MEAEHLFRGILLDLDGVITDTRRLHFQSWKTLFETFFQSKGLTKGFSETDYQRFVDGRPRSEGIVAYLTAQQLPPTEQEIEHLKSEKNRLYLDLLSKTSLEAYSDCVDALKLWKDQGLVLGVVSSSENCRPVLDKLQLMNQFDVCVDGTDGKIQNLRGKPEPDYFLEAIKRTGLSAQDFALVEDSLVGVSAAKKAKIETVYGISRQGQTPADALYDQGADMVITSLLEIGHPPNALEAWGDFQAHLRSRDFALFLDFDGTISEIVTDPKQARILESARAVLQLLSPAVKIAIVSGRDRLDVKKLVDLRDLFYAGDHGLDISGPGCFHFQVDEIQNFTQSLERFNGISEVEFGKKAGFIVEKKQFATAIHYRGAPEAQEYEVRGRLEKILQELPDLKIKDGKKVFEILPNVHWGKGEAVQKLCQVLSIDPEVTAPIFIGDDKTDEDAFAFLHGRGIGIRVDPAAIDTRAEYRLSDPTQVVAFLQKLYDTYAGEDKKWRRGH